MMKSPTAALAVVISAKWKRFNMDWASAIIAGIVATAVMTVLMTLGKNMGIQMDMPKMLGAMVVDSGSPIASRLGLVIHFMMGVVFAIVYAGLFDVLDVDASLIWGAVFGAGHGILAGAALGMMPMMHPRMGAGKELPAPGPFGVELGKMVPIALIAMHVIFGAVVGVVYSAA